MNKESILFFLGIIFLSSPQSWANPDNDPLKQSLVKIFMSVQEPNYYSPWNAGYTHNSGCSGSVINTAKGRRILTNAHCVANTTYLMVLKNGDTQKYKAQVDFVAHDCEVATIKVDDQKFFEGTKAVTFGVLPKQREKIAVYGFPQGGEDLSITEGVISRIEVSRYTHSGRRFLIIQTDAAINGGNSGGPVFKENKLIGLAFQAMAGEGVENIGYVVPITLVERFLKDIKDGQYDGIPELGITVNEMENKALRKFHGLKENQSGVLIGKAMPGSSAWGHLNERDVLVAIDGKDIANNGTVVLRDKERVDLAHLAHSKQAGEEIQVRVVRDGKPLTVTVPLKRPKDLVAGPTYDKQPTYYIHSGLVFIPLTDDYITAVKPEYQNDRLKTYRDHGLPTQENQQVVVIQQVLPHAINEGYHQVRDLIVSQINGRAISNIADVVAALTQPVVKDGGRYNVINVDQESRNATKIVLDASIAEMATMEILKRYNIAGDRSPDLEKSKSAKFIPDGI